MHEIGYLYENGLGVTQNNQTVLEWYSKAEDAGYDDKM
jgi:TPR repeat protein